MVAAILAAALWYWHAATPSTPASTGTGRVRPGPSRVPSVPGTAGSGAAAANDPERVLRDGSLRGTQADGDITIGFAGRVQPDLAMRRLFDYYLSLLGETDLDGIRRLLGDDLQRRRLAADQQTVVMRAFDRYLRYQQARTALAAPGPADLAARMAADRQLRDQWLGPALAQAFYPDAAAEDARLQQLLAHRQDAAAPTPDTPSQDPTIEAVGTIQAQTDRLDAEHADPAQRHAERAASWGEPAATRLDALDRQRVRWQQRLDRFAAAATTLQRDPALTTEQRAAALQALIDGQFQGTERLQARAMWQAGLLQAR